MSTTLFDTWPPLMTTTTSTLLSVSGTKSIRWNAASSLCGGTANPTWCDASESTCETRGQRLVHQRRRRPRCASSCASTAGARPGRRNSSSMST